VGDTLKSLLTKLKQKYAIIGDVRGNGLFLGIELVKDRKTLEPAATEADHIVNEMKGKGILLSTDGPDHNVIKVKPPMVFSRDNALTLVKNLDNILSFLRSDLE
jgi:4-aminobutyrate aminotransferase-like enzyme